MKLISNNTGPVGQQKDVSEATNEGFYQKLSLQRMNKMLLEVDVGVGV